MSASELDASVEGDSLQDVVRTQFVAIKPGHGQPIKPHYDSKGYRAFVKAEKAKGLQRKYWPELPKMWLEELKFRHELETALRSFAS